MATKPGGITYYAVDCRSMYSGYHYLEAYGREDEKWKIVNKVAVDVYYK